MPQPSEPMSHPIQREDHGTDRLSDRAEIISLEQWQLELRFHEEDARNRELARKNRQLGEQERFSFEAEFPMTAFETTIGSSAPDGPLIDGYVLRLSPEISRKELERFLEEFVEARYAKNGFSGRVGRPFDAEAALFSLAVFRLVRELKVAPVDLTVAHANWVAAQLHAFDPDHSAYLAGESGVRSIQKHVAKIQKVLDAG